MEVKDVLKNLTDYDGWEHTNYKLVKSEADVIIPLLRKEMPMETIKYDDSEVGDEGEVIYYEYDGCPVCKKSYRFLVPKYCEKCGQRLVRSRI